MSDLPPLLGGSVAAKQQHGGSSAGGGGEARRRGLSCHHPPPPGSQERTQRHHQVRLAVWSAEEFSGLRPEPDLAACICVLTQLGLMYSGLSRVSAHSQTLGFCLFVCLKPVHVFFSSPLKRSVTRWLRRITLLTNAHVSIVIKTTAAPHNGELFQELLQLLLLYFYPEMLR